MTRINLVPVEELADQHLIAEYREIFMILPALNRSLEAGTAREGIPHRYTLGEGHVKFFYNKGVFLLTRYRYLVREMKERGFKPSVVRVFPTWPDDFFHGYTFNQEDVQVSRDRIIERVHQRPDFYRWTKRPRPAYAGGEAAC